MEDQFKPLQASLDHLATRMTEMGMKGPSAQVTFTSGEEVKVFTHCKKSDAKYDWETDIEVFRGKTVEAAIAKAAKWIEEQPSPEETARKRAVAAMAKAIEAAREANVEAEFLNPLLTMMKRLSENALEGPKDRDHTVARPGDQWIARARMNGTDHHVALFAPTREELEKIVNTSAYAAGTTFEQYVRPLTEQNIHRGAR